MSNNPRFARRLPREDCHATALQIDESCQPLACRPSQTTGETLKRPRSVRPESYCQRMAEAVRATGGIRRASECRAHLPKELA
jgi:hypothetical protein